LVLIDTDGGATRRSNCCGARLGVVSLTESEGKDFAGRGRAASPPYGRMRERVRHAFRRFSRASPREEGEYPPDGDEGTVTTLASVHLGAAELRPEAVDGLMMPVESMRAISGMMSRMSLARAAGASLHRADRADSVVAGCAILEAIMDIWPAKTLGVADRGIREGILRSLMARDGHKI
jgi:exopolyphosphatase/guanosine-5'-triphosphate,3'-diphosphate pyrophosphatase